MQAILFIEKNFPLIIQKVDLPLDDVILRNKTSNYPDQGSRYFIPDYITTSGDPYGWLILKEEDFLSRFTLDQSGVGYRFVDITRK